MTKVIWLSDLHFSADSDVFGVNTRVRVTRIVEQINTLHPDAACCVISGDLVNRASDTAYQALAGLLQNLRPPVFPMVGNHDDRGLLRQHFQLPDTAMPDFVQYDLRAGEYSVLCLDTLTPGAVEGMFCTKRNEWLQARLADIADRPVIVFMHHPPFALGLPMQDGERLLNNGALLDQILGNERIKYLCCGHVHRPISGVFRGLPFSTLRSATFQAPPPVPEWTWSTFSPPPEAPQIGVLDLSPDGVTIQFHDLLEAAEV